MRRGSGRIEQAIIAAFAADPDNAFTVAELCKRSYPDGVGVDKKHRVAVLRAAQLLERHWPDLGWKHSEMLGRQKVFFNATSVVSFAMACLKGSNFVSYDNQDKRTHRFRRRQSEVELRASLRKGGKNHKHIVAGGAWRRRHDIWIARRDGDIARLKQLEAEQERDLNQIAGRHEAALRVASATPPPPAHDAPPRFPDSST